MDANGLPRQSAQRVDLIAVMAAVRRVADLSRDVAERQNALPERLAVSGQLFAPAAMLSPSVARLHARLHGDLVQAGVGDIKDLAGSVRERFDSARTAARLTDASQHRRTPSSAMNAPDIS